MPLASDNNVPKLVAFEPPKLTIPKKLNILSLKITLGITKADDVAHGVVDAIKESKSLVSIVIRLTGTNEEEGQRILEEAGIPYEISMEKAAKKAVDLCNKIKAEE